MILMFFVSTAWSFSIAGKVVKKLSEQDQKKVKTNDIKKAAKNIQTNKHVHKSDSSSHGFVPSQIKCEFLELIFCVVQLSLCSSIVSHIIHKVRSVPKEFKMCSVNSMSSTFENVKAAAAV